MTLWEASCRATPAHFSASAIDSINGTNNSLSVKPSSSARVTSSLRCSNVGLESSVDDDEGPQEVDDDDADDDEVVEGSKAVLTSSAQHS